MDAYGAVLRRLLFALDPERAHGLTLAALGAAAPLLARIPPPDGDLRLAQDLMGLRFPNPIGLAAGVDKRGQAVGAWPALGFGHVEVGTVTPLPQPGNPRPRMFRLEADGALVNRLGFANDGAAATAARLAAGERRAGRRVPVGLNLGRGKDSPPAGAGRDYADALRALWDRCDYVAVNVSSPNTPGLRDLQQRGPLAEVLRAVREADAERARARRAARRPVLVKIAPDLEPAEVDAVVDLAVQTGLAGVIATNTTLARDGLRSPPALAREAGGLSGAPLRARSTALVRRVAARAAGRLVVVGVGGVASGEDAWEKLAAGASLVQLYTALVYRGPLVARRIAGELLALMDRAGIAHVGELVACGEPPPQ